MVSRLPGWLVGGYRPLLAALRLAARLAPELPVPVWAYLDLDRVCGQPETRRRFLTDPLGLRCYPLGFLAELVTADLAGMRDGSIRCPVLVVAARGDPLFSLAYTRRVFDQIVAPAKELLVFEVDRHLLFNECVQLVTDPLVDRIRGLVAVPGPRRWARDDEPTAGPRTPGPIMREAVVDDLPLIPMPSRQGLWPSPLPSRSSPARHSPCIDRRHVLADP
jgi:hypothetical protein